MTTRTTRGRFAGSIETREIREQVIGNSLVLTKEIGYNGNIRVQVHLDRDAETDRVAHGEVTFWVADNPIEGGPCPTHSGADWESGIALVKWWLSGNMYLRANHAMSRVGYSPQFCTNQKDCNCESHGGYGKGARPPFARVVAQTATGGDTHGIQGVYRYGRRDNSTWCGFTGLMSTTSYSDGVLAEITCDNCRNAETP
ncbi:hypothetical protein [Streptomyces niveus]|uniref:hypothetical protein n=1 Tax=Streptomyces niveus TaxID=193462 RepID=UPI003690E1DB